MKKSALAGRCGIYCGACEFNRALLDPSIKKTLSRTLNLAEEDVYCKGCGDLDEHSYGKGCKTATCCDNHHVHFCHDCDEYPCNEIKEMLLDPYPHHHSVIIDLDRMKEVGTDRWLEEQKKRWSCKNCGESFCWYTKKCKKCGEKVISYCKENENEQIQ